jgi:cytochrome c oxidase subunit 1
MAEFKEEDRLIKSSIYLSYLYLALGGVFGVLQSVARAPGFPKLLTSSQYYLSISSHGILMVVAWITFFIIGLSLYVLSRSLDHNLHSLKLAWTSFTVALIGVFMTLAMLLSGRASVAWTFYAPLYANPLFYIGLVIFVAGTWLFTAEVYLTIRDWRKTNQDRALPLGVHGIAATLIMWIISTIPIAFEEIFLRIPWALNPEIGIDVELSRTLFWWFGHPVVYFWILPAVVVWYVYYPKLMGEEIYSDYFGRMVFVLFVVFSIPVGVPHQFQDPGISMGYKYIFTIFT